jgi:hypothetical protein
MHWFFFEGEDYRDFVHSDVSPTEANYFKCPLVFYSEIKYILPNVGGTQ